MSRPTPRVSRLLVLLAVALAGAAVGVAVAQGRTSDDTILFQTQVNDVTGDSGAGPDLSSFSAAAYADGSVGFTVRYANRGLLLDNETVQLFVDLNGDRQADLNFALWASGSASVLARWQGDQWTTVRQLPEAVEIAGAYSVRLPISVLRDAAGLPVAPEIGILVGSYTYTGASATFAPTVVDWLPNDQGYTQLRVSGPAAPTTTAPPVTSAVPTTTATRPKAPRPTAARLALRCVGHKLRATVTPPKGRRVVFVTFSVNGNPRSTDTKAPFTATFRIAGLHAPIKVSTAVHFPGKSQTLRGQARGC